MFKVRRGRYKTPASLIFAFHSSHWQQSLEGRKDSWPKKVLALGLTSEIYLLEHVLRVGVVMVTSEIYLLERVLRVGVAIVTSELRQGGALPSIDL